jgi:two-component system cell cycle sensor histidine kinase/response regulator CckA
MLFANGGGKMKSKDNSELDKDGSQGRVLVMDDEESIRNILKAILKKLGYTVEVALNGDQAISLYKEAFNEKNVFDIVILDLNVPGGIGGKEAIEILLEFDPKVNAIVSSGYLDDPVMKNYEKFGFKSIIVKPFIQSDIKKAIQFNNPS